MGRRSCNLLIWPFCTLHIINEIFIFLPKKKKPYKYFRDPMVSLPNSPQEESICISERILRLSVDNHMRNHPFFSVCLFFFFRTVNHKPRIPLKEIRTAPHATKLLAYEIPASFLLTKSQGMNKGSIVSTLYRVHPDQGKTTKGFFICNWSSIFRLL